MCADKSDCLEDSKCDGKSAECPAQKPLPTGTFCQNNTGTCGASGKCDQNVCKHYGQGTACMCTDRWYWLSVVDGKKIRNYTRKIGVQGIAYDDACFICCQKSSNEPCKRLMINGKTHAKAWTADFLDRDSAVFQGRGLCYQTSFSQGLIALKILQHELLRAAEPPSP